MTSRSPRIGLAFALALTLPLAPAGVWAWLSFGGAISRAEADEAAAESQCRATAERELTAGLLRAAAEVAERCALTLDADLRAVGPFGTYTPAAVPENEPSAIGLAEASAGARLTAGDDAGALPFFELAVETDRLSPQGWLSYCELVGDTDPERATQLLATARERFAAAATDLALPFELLAALRAANWTTAPAERDELGARAVAQLVRLDAETVAIAADGIVKALPELADDPRLAAVRAHAEAAIALGGRSAPESIGPGPSGSVLVPLDGDRLVVLPAAQVATARRTAAAAAHRRHPAFDVELPGLDPANFVIRSAELRGSRLLTWTARGSLALALLALVFGNLIVWRLTRRELALVRMRRDFVDVVSHELRTPLTSLSLKAEMLATGDVPESRRAHYLQSLYREVQKLTDQVDRILAFGRLEKGAPLQRESVPARAVLARGLRAGRPALRLVGQRLDVDAPRSLPMLDADVEVVTRALRNLLENAAKYAPPESTVTVRAFTDGADLVVEIEDRGPGIPAPERRAIFEPFVRRRESARVPGSGLGLALVAAAARAHGGRVDVKDGNHRGAEGKVGAVFSLRLPAGTAASNGNGAAS